MMQAIADCDVSRGSYKLVDGALSGEAGQSDYRKDVDDGDDILEYGLREKALVRKVDRRIMPCLFAMIILNHLDRNGLANARVQGIEQSLGLNGADFSTAISILFVGYITLQIPSNLLLTRVRPSVYLPGCMIAWGVVSGLSGFVSDFRGLVITRFLLGIVEAPFFPGALFLLSSWYTKRELALRTSILYSGSLLSGAFGGLVAASIEYFFHGLLGVDSWRWLFLIESTCTVVLAISAIFILPDYPYSTTWLTPEERSIAIARLQSASGMKDEARGTLLAGLRMALYDYKVWLLALIIITKTTAGAVTSFIPTLVATFNRSRIETLLLVAPPYLCAAGISLLVSRMSDKLEERSYHIIVPMAFAMFGFAVGAATMNLSARYLSLFLMLGGVYGSYNVALAWISSSLPHPIEKRSSAIAIINTMGNLAQIYSPFFYLPENGPQYLSAMVANVFFCIACIGSTLVLRYYLRNENNRLELAARLEEADDAGEQDQNFRYVL